VRLVDTSLFIGHERGEALALERIGQLLDEGALAVSSVTRYELTCSPRLPRSWGEFYRELFEAVPVLPVTSLAAALGAEAARRAAAGGAPVKAPDALIAGVALEHGLTVVTADADFLRLLEQVELVRTS